MTTQYHGRENDIDLGAGHSYVPLTFGDDPAFGAIVRHPQGLSFCGTIVLWGTAPYDVNAVVRYDTPDSSKPLTLSQPVVCEHCARTGTVENGRWIAA